MNEWRYLSELLKHGYPLMDALTLLEVDISEIQKQLEAGRDIFHILLPQKETNFSSHLKFFQAMMSFSHAIESALSLHQFEQGLQKKLIKKSAYPILIFVIAYGMLWFFTSAIIPMMMVSFESNASFQSLSLIITIIQGVCILIGIGIVILLILSIYLHLHKEVRVILLSKMKNVTLLNDYESYLFSGYLLQMETHGVSTRLCMQFFANLKKKSVLQTMTSKMRKQLEAGMSLHEVIESNDKLSKSFKLSFKIGSAANSLTSALEGFMFQQEEMWDRKIKKIGIVIQCISYAFVAMVVVIVYQIMLVPLEMLETM